MKSRILLSVSLIFVLMAGSALAQNDGIKGNGLPQSKLLFNLEVIAYDGNNCPSGDMIGNNTHRIAVKADVSDNPSGQLVNTNTLIRQNDIMLAPAPEGEGFAVLDGNACIDGVARFQLPTNPCSAGLDIPCDTDDPIFQEYAVYGRLVGKPNTGVDVTTCATTDAGTPNDTSDDYIVCSTESWVSVRQSGKGNKPHFENVSKQLLSICLNTDTVAGCDVRYALFASELYDYFWNWNTTGKAHAQLFFVAIPD